jgi:hypothetical protein
MPSVSAGISLWSFRHSNSKRTGKSESLCGNRQIFVRRGFSRAVKYAELVRL